MAADEKTGGPSSFAPGLRTCVWGASGGIGRAFVDALAASPLVKQVYAGVRREIPAKSPIVCPFTFDLEDEASIVSAAECMKADGPLNLVIVATGLLSDETLSPEKSWSMQSADAYARAFAVNSIGPALIGKHMLPALAKGEKAVFAALSARVGSISDNGLGGWHAYRASKAALNMIVRNFALELAGRNKTALAVTLHPGTVDTWLSKPFQGNVPEGKLFTADYSARALLTVLDGLTPADSGGLFAWDGQRIPF